MSITKVKAPAGKLLWLSGALETAAEEAALLNPHALAHMPVWQHTTYRHSWFKQVSLMCWHGSARCKVQGTDTAWTLIDKEISKGTAGETHSLFPREIPGFDLFNVIFPPSLSIQVQNSFALFQESTFIVWWWGAVPDKVWNKTLLAAILWFVCAPPHPALCARCYPHTVWDLLLERSSTTGHRYIPSSLRYHSWSYLLITIYKDMDGLVLQPHSRRSAHLNTHHSPSSLLLLCRRRKGSPVTGTVMELVDSRLTTSKITDSCLNRPLIFLAGAQDYQRDLV